MNSFKALCKSKELEPTYFKIFNLGFKIIIIIVPTQLTKHRYC